MNIIEIENQIIALIKSCEFGAVSAQLDLYDIDNFSSAEYASIHTLKSLLLFLQGDVAAIGNYPEKCVEIFHERYGKGREFFRHGNMVSIFNIYLNKLNKWKENNPEYYSGEWNRELYLIGDSHCLSSAHHVVDGYKLLPKLLFNAKAYNIKNTAFRKLIESCKNGSDALFMFGEIDCRINEGIYPNSRDLNEDELNAAVQKTVDEYVDFVHEVCADKFDNIRFCNVPAPQVGLCKAQGFDVSEHPIYPKITALFNECLARKLDDKNIVDVYSLTADKGGWGKRDNMLDQVHLMPDVVSGLT